MHIKTVRVWPEPIITINLILCDCVPNRNRNLTSPALAYQLLGLPHHNRRILCNLFGRTRKTLPCLLPNFQHHVWSLFMLYHPPLQWTRILFPNPDKYLQTTLPWSGCFLHLSPPPVLHLTKPCASSKTHMSPCL